jgi:hypothetical protein
MVITSQRSSSQVKGALIGICAAVSPTYSRIRVRALPRPDGTRLNSDEQIAAAAGITEATYLASIAEEIRPE